MKHFLPEEVSFCGIKVRPCTIPELNRAIAAAIAVNRRMVIANHNLHSLYLFHRDARLREFFAKADLAHIDGMSLVFLARCLGFSVSRERRVTYVDWVGPLLAEAAQSGWRVFFLGGRPGVADRAAERLRREHPGLQLSVRHGYFDMKQGSADNEAVVSEINAYGPHVLMVGMGMPRQEHWILENLHELRVRAVLPAGACFDYVAGEVPTPPRWMGRAGIEWCYRLASEPGRLWRRYLCEPLLLSPLVMKEMLRRIIPASPGERA